MVDLIQHSLAEAHGLVRPLLQDLTDDEYFCEPAPGCWSVRRNREPFPPELPSRLSLGLAVSYSSVSARTQYQRSPHARSALCRTCSVSTSRRSTR